MAAHRLALTDVTIRRALPAEAHALTSFATRSKRHWGYDEAFMERVAPMLRVEEEALRRCPAFVAESGGEMVGFYRLNEQDGDTWMTDLWVEPARIGAGLGRLLWDHARATARALGWKRMTIAADPNAEAFYLRCGATRTGEIDGGAGRRIPLLRYDL